MTWAGPRTSVEALVQRIGPDAFVDACLDLLAGRDVQGGIVHALGGPAARWAVDGGESGPSYWLRVWALRGLLWHWDDRATAATAEALGDEAWRVREMAAKVAARHRVEEALPGLVTCQQDVVARVQAAAHRAVERITS